MSRANAAHRGKAAPASDEGASAPIRSEPLRTEPKPAASAAPPPGWAGARWMRLVETIAEGEPLREGLELNRAGKVREVAFARGEASGVVQERPGVARQTTLRVATLDHPSWERAARAMADQAMYAARLLAGELPPTIEDLLGPLGLHLFPTEPSEITPKCNCARREGWCRHACALAAAVGQRLEREPFAIFELRGISSADLLDHLRARRALAGDAAAIAAVRRAGTMGGADLDPGPALEQCVESFWAAGPSLEDVDTTPRPPSVPHALLRRLGPSPFPKGGFPLIGLLASVYDTVSAAALREPVVPATTPDTDPGAEPDAGSHETPCD